jgi:hypothetical protein
MDAIYGLDGNRVVKSECCRTMGWRHAARLGAGGFDGMGR